MSDTLQMPGDNPNAPKIPSQVYFNEKANFAGMVTCAGFYGIAIILFLQCMDALLNPVHRAKGRIKWPLVVHTVAIFLFLTVFTAINLDILSISYINNREIRGATEVPGPLGYQWTTYSAANGIASTLMFLLNNWLADGLLLYRCYIIYGMNSWAIAFPFLVYLATFATGIVVVYYQASQPNCAIWGFNSVNFGVTYSISVSLDVILTLMITARLVLISREIRNAMNAPFRISGLYKATITILSESSALYAVTFLLWVGTWAAKNSTQYFFFPILAQTQVIAPFLVILRVANRRTVNGGDFSGDIVSIPSSQGESTSSGGTSPGGHSTSSAGMDEKSPGEFDVKLVTNINSDHNRV